MVGKALLLAALVASAASSAAQLRRGVSQLRSGVSRTPVSRADQLHSGVARTPVSRADLSDYEQEVLTAAEEAMAAGTCLSRTESSQCTGSCYGDVDSVYIEYEEGDYRYVIANGIPSHTADEGRERPNANEACENRAYLVIPATTTTNRYRTNRMGPIGLALSGGFIYNPLSGTSGVDDIAVLNEGVSFDNCNGHSDGKCFYHYHDDAVCISDDDCPLVGYLRDGVPVYGYCSIDGTQLQSCYSVTSGDGNSSGDYEWAEGDDCHLDENNGYTFEDGTYGYVMTDSYPYTPRGYMATAQDICYF